MPPDDRATERDPVVDTGVDMPVDADLESLDVELAAAGAHARRMLYGRSQPTRVFSNQLRARLLETFEPPVTTSGEGELALPREPERELYIAPQALIAREAHRAGSSDQPAAGQRNEVMLRPILALLTIAGMAALLALGASSGSFGPPLQ